MAEEKKLKPVRPPPDAEMLRQLEFLKELELMEMVVDTGLDKKMAKGSERKGK